MTVEQEKFTLTSDIFLDAFLANVGTNREGLHLPPRAGLAFQSEGLQALIGASRAARMAEWTFPISDDYLYLGRYQGQEVLIAKIPSSAPNAVAYTEILISLGVRQFLVMGAAGSIHPDAPPCGLVAPTSAIREEGTSYHYLNASHVARPSEKFVGALEKAAQMRHLSLRFGPTWTTDAVFRETRAKALLYRQCGILTVEMEMAALFILAMVKGVDLGGLLVISDTHHGESEIVYFGKAYGDAVLSAADLLLGALCSSSDDE